MKMLLLLVQKLIKSGHPTIELKAYREGNKSLITKLLILGILFNIYIARTAVNNNLLNILSVFVVQACRILKNKEYS